ncbi:L,D-transpeptidase, partial [Rhizobium ruizarguesonis]
TKDAGYSLPAIPIDRVKPQFRRQVVSYQTTERPGTIIVNTRELFLYYILANGKAMRYGIVVGKQGFAWPPSSTSRMRQTPPTGRW